MALRGLSTAVRAEDTKHGQGLANRQALKDHTKTLPNACLCLTLPTIKGCRMPAKLTFDDALQAINDQRRVDASTVQASALRRIVWVAEWHIPGCLSESQSFCLTQADAIESACSMAETENGAPRGMKTALRKYGRFDCRTEMFGMVVNTVQRMTLGDLL